MKQLRNYTEDAVKAYLDKWYKDEDVCQCEGCRLDVMAIMLNNLKPQYVVTDTGALYAQMSEFEQQNRIDYMTEMTHAIQIISKRPRRVERPMKHQQD
jgi:competence protein ComFB